MSSSVLLGDDTTTNEAVRLEDEERLSGLYVLGRPGTGKTNLLSNLALHDIKQGHGLFFLDPHGDAIDALLTHGEIDRLSDKVLNRRFSEGESWKKIHFPHFIDASEVWLLDPEKETHAFGINLTYCTNTASLNQRVNTYTKAYNIFRRAFAEEWGPWLQLIIQNTLYAFIENQGYTLAEAPRFLLDAEFRNKLVSNMRHNPEVVDFWRYRFSQRRERDQEAQVDAALTRFSTFLGHPYVRDIIGQTKTTIDFARIMKERKIVLVKLSANLSEDIKRFIGTIFISELLHAVRSRKEGQRHYFSVIVDEFQNFATSDFATLITEGRKFGVATTIAHQERVGQLRENPQVLGATLATGNKVIFQPTVHDAQELAPEFARFVQEKEGREAELVLSPHPVEDLWDTGHPDKDAMFARGKYLWIVELLRQYPNQEFFEFDPSRVPDEYMTKNPFLYQATLEGVSGHQYRISARELRKGIQLLNTYLYNWMSGKYQPEYKYDEYESHKERDFFLEIVHALSGIFGFYQTMQATISPLKREILQKAYEQYFERQKQQELRRKQLELQGRLRGPKPYEEGIVARYQEKGGWRDDYTRQNLRLANSFDMQTLRIQDELREFELRQPGMIRIPDTFNRITMEQWKHQAAVFGLSSYEIDNLFDWVPIALTDKQRYMCQRFVTGAMAYDNLPPLTYDPSYEQTLPPSRGLAYRILSQPPPEPEAKNFEEWQLNEIWQFTAVIRKLGRILHGHPVKRQSGQYGQTVKVERTQQDLINEAAKELADLPKYIAYCKLMDREKTRIHKIRTVRFEDGKYPNFCVLSEQEAYYTSRESVEREIAKRLKDTDKQPGRDQPPPPTA